MELIQKHWGIIIGGTAFAIFLFVAAQYHLARKERFLTGCMAEHSQFECQYRWDTLMARERAATNSATTD